MLPHASPLPHLLFAAAALLIPAASVFAAPAAKPDAPASATWRSALYPENWTPGFSDAEGRFLHDFSYAGYRRGDAPLPTVKTAPIDVTAAPYNADATGVKDATTAIQSALDAAAKAGGGVVLLPAGTYRVAPPEGSDAALCIEGDNIVLRGAGTGRTFLFNDSVEMRTKRVISVKAKNAAWWFGDAGKSSSLLTGDVLKPTTKIPVEKASVFAVGDEVLLRIDPTPRFIEELGMTGKWVVNDTTPKAKRNNLTLIYIRRIVAIEDNNLVIDVPTRLPLRTADNARVQKISGKVLTEVGLEDFSIGMKQHPATDWSDEEGYDKTGTGPYAVHGSYAISFESTENSWVRRVNTYAPPGNDPHIHLLSNGVLLGRTRFLTIENCDFKFPQYRGGGGNGYLYALHGNEGLIRDCIAEGGRHNYDFGLMSASGNVITKCTAKDGRLFSDFHMFLSAVNLIDAMTCDGDTFEAVFRPYGGTPMHGVTTTQSVFWNTRGLRYSASPFEFSGKMHKRPQVVILSKQWGHGYVIGTQGPASAVESDDFVEGVGKSATLQPQSLYADQLARRQKR